MYVLHAYVLIKLKEHKDHKIKTWIERPMSRLFFLLLKFSFRSERFRPSYLILYSKRAGKPFWVLSRSFFLLSDVSLERFCYRVAFTVPETCSVFLFFYSCFLWQTCFFQHSLILGKLLGRYGHFCFCIDLAECFASDGSNAGCFLPLSPCLCSRGISGRTSRPC